MISTVVGSYPVSEGEVKTFKDKLLKSIGSYDPYKIAIDHAVNKQLSARIDLISDGQVRDNMVKIFAKGMTGYEFDGNLCKICNKIGNPDPSTVANDLKYAKSVMDKKLKEMDLTKKEREKKGIKGLITGPNTMIFSSSIETKLYKTKESAILDMAETLKFHGIALEKAGAKVIQIDEPFISTGLVDLKTAKKSIEIISKEVNIPVALHCCGDISNVLESLVYFDVDILDFEFAGHKQNLKVLEKYRDEFNGKKLGLGCIDTKKPKIESVEEIAKIINGGLELFDTEDLYIDPDCGMRNLEDNVAFSKLKNMTEAINSFDS
ncbi:MAG: methionine synthase [Methanobrevibacter sp.]|jgi:5-methyltetrahydropteroyltriglutamate--homocysteine methyltransferase|nr:methionine synthase [Methanobrevibacter sp.]